MDIYIACGLTHVPRELFDSYVAYLHALATAIRELPGVEGVKYALVDSDPQLSQKPEGDRASLCYAWDRRMVEEADLVVADASFPSTGLGIEMQIAESAGTPIVVLVGDYGVNRVKKAHYANPDHTEHDLQIGDGIVSLMALGVPSIRSVIGYSDHREAIGSCSDAVKVFVPAQ